MKASPPRNLHISILFSAGTKMKDKTLSGFTKSLGLTTQGSPAVSLIIQPPGFSFDNRDQDLSCQSNGNSRATLV